MRCYLHLILILAVFFSSSPCAALTLKDVKITLPRKGGDSFTITLEAPQAITATSADTTLKLGSETFRVPSASLFNTKGKLSTYVNKKYGIKSAKYNAPKKVLTIKGSGLALTGLPRILPIRIKNGQAESCGIVTLKKASAGKSKYTTLISAGAVLECAIEALRVLEPAVLVAKEFTGATFSAAVTSGFTVDGGVLQLKEVNAAGKVANKVLCTMTDTADGNADNVYACDVSLSYPKTGEQSFVAEGTVGGKKVRSQSALLKILATISDSALEDFHAVDAIAPDLSVLDLDDKAGRIAVVMQLKKLAVVADAFLAANEQDIVVVYKSGLKGFILGSARPVSDGTTPALVNQLVRSRVQPPIRVSTAQLGNSVLIWDSGYFPAHLSESGPLRKLFEAVKEPRFSITSVNDDAASVDSISSFTNFNTIIMVTHGVMDEFGQVGALTGSRPTKEFEETYKTDIKLGRLRPVSAPSIGGLKIVAMPSYFRNLPGTFPNSLLYAGFCHSLQNDLLSGVLLGKGVASMVGYSRTVFSEFASKAAKQLFCGMLIEGKDIGGAFGGVTPKIDQYQDKTETTDPDQDRARINLAGSFDTKFSDSDFKFKIVPEGVLEIPFGFSLDVSTNVEIDGPLACTQNTWTLKEKFATLEDQKNSSGKKIVVPDSGTAPAADSITVKVKSTTSGDQIASVTSAIKYICKRKNFKLALPSTELIIGKSMTVTIDRSEVDDDCKPEIEFFVAPETDDSEKCAELIPLGDGKGATINSSKCTSEQILTVSATVIFRREDGGVRFKLASPKRTLALKKEASGINATYKVFINTPISNTEVIVAAIAPASLVGGGGIYCATIPVYDSFKKTVTPATLGLEFLANPCASMGRTCQAGFAGEGNLAAAITLASGGSLETRDSVLALYQGIYSGSFPVRKRVGSSCAQ